MKGGTLQFLRQAARGRRRMHSIQTVRPWTKTTSAAAAPRNTALSIPRTRQQESFFSTSVSETEVQKFNALHTEWWDPKKNPLIQMNTIRVQYIREQVETQITQQRIKGATSDDQSTTHAKTNSSLPFEGLSMLDIGCGGGVLTESLARLGAKQAVGIDPSANLLQVAKQRAATFGNQQSPEYHCTTAEEWALQHPQQYDVVCILDVIEHIPHIESVGRAISKLLKPDGLLIVSSLNRTALSYALTIVGAEYVMGYVPAGTHDWNLYRSPTEVQALWQPLGLQQSHVSGMVLRQPPLLKWDWKLDPHDLNINWVAAYQLQATSAADDDQDS